MELNQVLDDLTTIMSDIIKKHKEDAISKEALSQITYAQFILIHRIKETEDATITRLADVLDLTKPTVTAGVNKLIKLELVEKRGSSEDKRVQYIELTPRGESIGNAEMNAFDECIDLMRHKLGDDFEQFEDMLRRLLK